MFFAFLSTLFGWAIYGYGLNHSLFFFLRLCEYCILTVIVPTFIRSKKDLSRCFKIYFIAFSINSLWLICQVVTINKGPALEFVKIYSYGYTLLSVSQPLAVGGLWLFSYVLFTSYILYKKYSNLLMISIFISFFGLVLSLSRTSIGTVLFVTPISMIILYYANRENKAGIVTSFTCIVFILSVFVMLLLQSDIGSSLPLFRMNYENANDAIASVRYEKIWLPLIGKVMENPFVGYGVGNISKIIADFDEGHNYFLRILVEIGLPGFLCFIIVLCITTYRLLRNVFKRTYVNDKYLFTLNAFSLLWILSISFMAIFQDAFWSTELAIPTFTIIGITNWLCSVKRKAPERY